LNFLLASAFVGAALGLSQGRKKPKNPKSKCWFLGFYLKNPKINMGF
jgi:hypothetical protein